MWQAEAIASSSCNCVLVSSVKSSLNTAPKCSILRSNKKFLGRGLVPSPDPFPSPRWGGDTPSHTSPSTNCAFVSTLPPLKLKSGYACVFIALKLLVVWQEGDLACKKYWLTVTTWWQHAVLRNTVIVTGGSCLEAGGQGSLCNHHSVTDLFWQHAATMLSLVAILSCFSAVLLLVWQQQEFLAYKNFLLQNALCESQGEQSDPGFLENCCYLVWVCVCVCMCGGCVFTFVCLSVCMSVP